MGRGAGDPLAKLIIICMAEVAASFSSSMNDEFDEVAVALLENTHACACRCKGKVGGSACASDNSYSVDETA